MARVIDEVAVGLLQFLDLFEERVRLLDVPVHHVPARLEQRVAYHELIRHPAPVVDPFEYLGPRKQAFDGLPAGVIRVELHGVEDETDLVVSALMRLAELDRLVEQIVRQGEPAHSGVPAGVKIGEPADLVGKLRPDGEIASGLVAELRRIDLPFPFVYRTEYSERLACQSMHPELREIVDRVYEILLFTLLVSIGAVQL